MSEIISKVIAIDKEACEMIEKSKAHAEEIIKHVDIEADELRKNILARSEKSISGVKEHYDRKYQNEIIQIEKDKAIQFEKLEKSFEDNFEKWAEDIYNKITQNTQI